MSSTVVYVDMRDTDSIAASINEVFAEVSHIKHSFTFILSVMKQNPKTFSKRINDTSAAGRHQCRSSTRLAFGVAVPSRVVAANSNIFRHVHGREKGEEERKAD
jgi:hypothetical protein